MKKWILFVVIAVIAASCCPNNAIGQNVTVDKSKLSPAALAEIEKMEANNAITKELEQYSEWAGMGSEIGIAIREGLTAVKDVALEFADTDVGYYTMMLIIWEYAGIDIIQLIVGGFLFIVITFLVSRSYFRTFKRKILIKTEGWGKAKEWELVTSDENKFWENPSAAGFVHWLFLMISWIVCSIIMFV